MEPVVGLAALSQRRRRPGSARGPGADGQDPAGRSARGQADLAPHHRLRARPEPPHAATVRLQRGAPQRGGDRQARQRRRAVQRDRSRAGRGGLPREASRDRAARPAGLPRPRRPLLPRARGGSEGPMTRAAVPVAESIDAIDAHGKKVQAMIIGIGIQ